MTNSALRRIEVLIVGTVLVGGLVPTVAASTAGTRVDITSTQKGRAIAQESASRFTQRGVATRADSLRVIDLGSDGLLVAPAGLVDFTDAVTMLPDGHFRTETTVVTEPRNRLSSTDGILAPTTTLSTYWSQWAQQCFARYQNTAMYLDNCYVIHKLINDGVGTRDYYQLEHYATAGSKSGNTIKYAWLASSKNSTSSTMTWVDWSPRGDAQSNCMTIGIGVSALGYGISSSATRCELWDILKGDPAGQFSELWSCECAFGIHADREIDYMQAIYVPQGGRPVWNLGWGFGN